MLKTKRLILVVAIPAAALAIALAFILSPVPAIANAALGSHMGGFGPWHSGPGAMMWHSGNNFFMSGNGSRANWTGSVSIQSLKSNILDEVKSNVKVDIVDAASTAQTTLGNGSKIGAISLAPINGYLVYQAYGIDSSDKIHRLIIDVGNGKVLEDSTIDTSGFGPWSQGIGGPWK